MSEMKEFKGLEVIVEEEGYNDTKGYVAMIDIDFGISINDENDNPLFCINKKEIVKYGKEREMEEIEEAYTKAFYEIIEKIKSGKVEQISFRKGKDNKMKFGKPLDCLFFDNMSCAFN